MHVHVKVAVTFLYASSTIYNYSCIIDEMQYDIVYTVYVSSSWYHIQVYVY